ncbi:MAG: hypothetical protein ACKVW3_01130 [Phycisphaerales bacterium]
MSTKLVILEKPKEEPMGASFEERSVWVQLVGMVVGLGVYFVIAGRMLAAGVRAMPAYAALFIVATVLMVILLVAGHIVMALASKPEGQDERDRVIAWRAEHNSSWVLATGVLAAVTGMVFEIEAVWIANLLLLSLALSEVLGFVLRPVYYRRGI